MLCRSDVAVRVQHGRRPPDRRAGADRKARRQSEPLARCAPHLAAAVAESLVFTDATWLCTRTSGGDLCRQHSLVLRHAGVDHARQERRAEDRAGSGRRERSEEHTSELQSLMRNSYAVFCLKKKKKQKKSNI